jgi:asparagine synthetase B (glutamine-hydrolysing)
VIYDNKHKQPFAARDPSGEECLYYHISEDGAVSFASSRLDIPDGEQPHEWKELPPGHYISGMS